MWQAEVDTTLSVPCKLRLPQLLAKICQSTVLLYMYSPYSLTKCKYYLDKKQF